MVQQERQLRVVGDRGKLVQRVIYKYDNQGNRSKPLIISLNTGGNNVQEIAPTMRCVPLCRGSRQSREMPWR